MTYAPVWVDFHNSAQVYANQEIEQSGLLVFSLLVKTEGQPYLLIGCSVPNADGTASFDFSIGCDSSGNLRISFDAVDAGLGNIGHLVWTGPTYNPNTVYGFTISIDTSGQRSHCWVNGSDISASTTSWPVTPSPIIAGTSQVTLNSNTSSMGYTDLCLADFYLAQPGSYLTTVDGFWSAGPVDPGPAGQGPTGFFPLVMLFVLPTETDVEQFKVNRSPDGTGPFSGSTLYFCASLFLNTPSGVLAGVPPFVSGTDSEVTLASALDASLDGGSWLGSGIAEFVPASGYGELWSGQGPAADDGTHTLQVRNHATTSVVSNIVTYTIGGEGGTGITLNQIYDAMDGIPPSISGIDYESPVAMIPLQYLLDSATGGVWMEEVEEFIPALAEGDTWTGFGPAAGPGTHTLQVRSTFADSTGGATSNEIVYVIQDNPPPPPPDEDCCVPLPSKSLGRYRGAVGINFFGKTLIGDAFSGVIGSANFDTFTEYGNTMRALVAAPPIHSDRKRVFIPRFELDIESGVGQPECCGSDPQWMLDWSKDGGRTWSEVQVFRGMGRIGEFTRRLRWLRMGQARQWVFRLQSTDPVRRVIIGAYVDTFEGMG